MSDELRKIIVDGASVSLKDADWEFNDAGKVTKVIGWEFIVNAEIYPMLRPLEDAYLEELVPLTYNPTAKHNNPFRLSLPHTKSSANMIFETKEKAVRWLENWMHLRLRVLVR